MNLLSSNYIEIDSLMSQEISENSETQWCYQIMMWFALSSISQYSDKRYLLHDVTSIQFQIFNSASMLHLMKIQNTIAILQILDRTFYNSTLRHISCQYMSSNLDSFVFAVFASMYDLVLQNLRHWESLLESSRQYIAERVRIYIAEKALECASLKKPSRWKSLHENFKLIKLVKIQSRWHRRLLWKSVENTIFADVLQSESNWYNLTKEKLVRSCWN